MSKFLTANFLILVELQILKVKQEQYSARVMLTANSNFNAKWLAKESRLK